MATVVGLLAVTVPTAAPDRSAWAEDVGVELTRTGTLDLGVGGNPPSAAVVDPAGRYAYIGTGTRPGRIIKVDLATLQEVGRIATTEFGQRDFASAVIDPAGLFAYFGTATDPARLVKVDLQQFEIVDALTISQGGSWARAAFIDAEGRYAYVGSATSNSSVNGRITQIDLETFQERATLQLRPSQQVLAAALSPDGRYGYVAASTRTRLDIPAELVRIELDRFGSGSAVRTLELDLDGGLQVTSMALAPTGRDAYLGTMVGGRVLSVDLDAWEQGPTLLLEPDEEFHEGLVVEPGGRNAAITTSGSPRSKVVQLDLERWERRGAVLLAEDERTPTMAVRLPDGASLLVGTSTGQATIGDGRLARLRLQPTEPPPPAPDLRLRALEATQAVQSWAYDLSLVSGKTTVVRAFVEVLPGDAHREVSGLLHGTVDGVPLPGSPLVPLNPGGRVLAVDDVVPLRGDLAASLNFLLPDEWTRGDGGLHLPVLRLEVPGAVLSCEEAAFPAGTCAVEPEFSVIDRPDVRLVNVAGPDGALSDAELLEQYERMVTILPIEDVQRSLGRMTVSSSTRSLTWINTRLGTIRRLDGCFTSLGCDRFYAGVMPGQGGGLANVAVSSSYLENRLAAGDGGHARNRVAHELAHNYGRPHTVTGGGLIRQSGTCGETASLTAPRHPDWHVRTARRKDGPTTQLVPTLGPMGHPDQEIWGVDARFVASGDPALRPLTIIDPNETFALLGYCASVNTAGQGRWMSARDWTALHRQFRLEGVGVPPLVEIEVGDAPLDEAPRDRLLLRGGVEDAAHGDAGIEVGWLDPVLPLPDAPSGDPWPTGPYELRLLDGDGEILEVVSVGLRSHEHDIPLSGDEDEHIGEFLVEVEDPGPALARLELRSPTAGLLDALEATSAPAVLTATGALDVAMDGEVAATGLVSITSPEAQSTVDGPDLVVAWSPMPAPDGTEPVYVVQYRTDDAAAWRTLAIDHEETQLRVPRASLPGSDTARVRVLASSGLDTEVATSQPFRLVGSAPTVLLERPGSTTTLVLDPPQVLFLAATAFDQEDGTLDGAALRWSADSGRELGVGRRLEVPAADLGLGTHTVTVSATDTDGNTVSRSASVEVLATAQVELPAMPGSDDDGSGSDAEGPSDDDAGESSGDDPEDTSAVDPGNPSRQGPGEEPDSVGGTPGTEPYEPSPAAPAPEAVSDQTATAGPDPAAGVAEAGEVQGVRIARTGADLRPLAALALALVLLGLALLLHRRRPDALGIGDG